MVLKTFERFVRYETGFGFEDFWNLYEFDEAEETLKKLFADWLKKETPTESMQIVAKLLLKNTFGYEI